MMRMIFRSDNTIENSVKPYILRQQYVFKTSVLDWNRSGGSSLTMKLCRKDFLQQIASKI
ncbi:hypothetical protein CHS0354_016809 [Potamilus streckersoni]|uniref:Uncharacterized protein n=1 Tax=Potamilus streckersoni TaxID=2493646 RepID=A0AAE0T3B3_9BIVA|nr:hypothetical protein CHS0354_016809 [Potamilus streckersoni]